MKRTLGMCLALLWVSPASGAADRVLVRREYYYSTNPEVMRVVGQLFDEQNRQLAEIHKQDGELSEKIVETLDEVASGQNTPDTKFLKRIDDLNRRQADISRETESKLLDVLGRSAPYLALECVVAQGSSEEAHAVIHGEKSTYHVGFSDFDGKTPELVVTAYWDTVNPSLYMLKEPQPVPLNVTYEAEWLLHGGKYPVDVAFERASLAPEDRPNGCSATQPGGEAPPPIVPRQSGPPAHVLYSAPGGSKY